MRIFPRRLKKLDAGLPPAHEAAEDTGEDTQMIISSLREKEAPQGPFFCDLALFRAICRIEARNSERSGRSLYVLSVAVTDEFGNVPESAVLAPAIAALENILRSSLRKGDTVADYTDYQILVLLTGEHESGSEIVSQRISDGFAQTEFAGKLQLTVGGESL